jgi:hypothetical protein
MWIEGLEIISRDLSGGNEENHEKSNPVPQNIKQEL